MVRKVVLCTLVGLFIFAGTAFAGGGRQQRDANVLEIWSIQVDGDGPGIFQRAIERFNRSHPDIRVNLTKIANDVFKQRLAVAMAAGQAPDLFHSWSGGPMFEYANNNQILDLTPFFNANPAFRDRIMEGALAQATYNGRIWGVPLTNISIATIFYNREIFQRLNLRAPTTIGELENVADVLIANGITPFSLANATRWTGSMFFMYLATRRGGIEPFTRAVDGSGSFNHPAFIHAGERIQDWVRRGFFLPGFNGLDWDAGLARAPLYRGETAMVLMGSWFVSQAQAESPEFAQIMGAFPFPRDEHGVGDPREVVGTMGDNFYHINADTRNPEAAFRLLMYLLDDQAVEESVNDGRIPPVRGVRIDNPLLREVFEQVNNATAVQLWYDQSLAPEVAHVHLITSQEIFGLTRTSASAAQELHDAQQAYLRRR